MVARGCGNDPEGHPSPGFTSSLLRYARKDAGHQTFTTVVAPDARVDAQLAIAASPLLHQMHGTRCIAANKTNSEAIMLYLIYMIMSYRNDVRARATAANDTDYRQAA